MSDKTFMEQVKAYGLHKVLGTLDDDPDNLLRLLAWVDRLDRDDNFLSQRNLFRDILEHPDNNWYQLIHSLWTDIDDEVRTTLLENFVVNAGVIGYARQQKAKEENGCNIPWAILMDPTSACNLRCTGCWRRSTATS